MNVKNPCPGETKWQSQTKMPRFSRQVMAILIVTVLAAGNFMTAAKAAAGDLDPSFGNGGLVTTDFGIFLSRLNGLAIQVDGKVVAAGFEQDNGGKHFALARYNKDGSLDPTFGSGGKVITSFPADQTISLGLAVAIQPDGKIVAGGSVVSPAGFILFALARYNTDGTLDASFGSGGTVSFSVGVQGFLLALALQSDGRIVAVGKAFRTGNPPPMSVIARLNHDGSADDSFGDQGIVLGDLSFFEAVALQTDGRIVATGAIGPNDLGFGVVRYNTDGILDSSFGLGGIDLIPFATGVIPGGISILSDGRILVGSGADNGASCAIARYNTDGSLDASFGVGGVALASVPGAYMAVLPNGKIIAAGTAFTFSGTQVTNQFSVTAFNSDGSLDTTFGTDGSVVTATPLFQNPFAGASVPYGNNKVIVGGWLNNAPPSVGFALARYLADSTAGAGAAGAAAADLGVTMSSSLSQDANGNSLITYTIAATNNGPDPSYYVTLSDDVPPGTVFESLTVPPGWVAYSEPAVGRTGLISVSSSRLSGRSADPAILTLVVKATQHHRAIPNHVSISSSFTADPNGSNNQAHTVTRVP